MTMQGLTGVEMAPSVIFAVNMDIFRRIAGGKMVRITKMHRVEIHKTQLDHLTTIHHHSSFRGGEMRTLVPRVLTAEVVRPSTHLDNM